MEGVWATIFICHLIFGGHLLNIPSLKANYNNASSNPASYVAVFNGSKMLILLFFF